MTIQTSTEASEAYIALGANLGDREATLKEAISLLDEHPGIRITSYNVCYTKLLRLSSVAEPLDFSVMMWLDRWSACRSYNFV